MNTVQNDWICLHSQNAHLQVQSTLLWTIKSDNFVFSLVVKPAVQNFCLPVLAATVITRTLSTCWWICQRFSVFGERFNVNRLSPSSSSPLFLLLLSPPPEAPLHQPELRTRQSSLLQLTDWKLASVTRYNRC